MDIDAGFFKLSKAEAMSMDPEQRQLLEVVYEGLENSGVTLEEVNNAPIGCFVSSYACDYGDIQARDPETRAPAATVGIGRAMLSNRISHFLNIKGPSMTIDTACSGSLVGVDIAMRYLQSGEITGAIVGGCNMYLSPEHVMDAMSANGTASATGRCHTFDAKADGYIKSKAVNMVYLTRLDDAIRDENSIRGIIRGSATGSDGWTADIASPNSEAQAATIRQAYKNAKITNLGQTSYVECHGTGTRAGDVIEVNGVASVFSAFKTAEQPLRIGSVKSNIGHSEPAAGISGLIKTVLALEAGIIPGNPTFKISNPNIDFNGTHLVPSRTTTRWRVPPRSRRAGVNSFGYGGANAHLIVDCANGQGNHVSSYLDEDDDVFTDEVPNSNHRPYLFAFSANDERSLRDFTTILDRHLANPSVRVNFRDLAYTLSEKRTRHFQRGFVVTRNNRYDHHSLISGKERQTPLRVGLVFTGQGAQWPQMGKDLITTFPVARANLVHLDEVLQSLPDGPEWSLQEELSALRTSEFYRRPDLSQTLVTALQLALLAVLDYCDVPYEAVVGHSSGEIAAAVAAGFLTPEDAIKIAYYRGIATVERVNDGSLGMMAVGLSEDEAKTYIRQHDKVQVACLNSPSSVTLFGDRAELIGLEAEIKKDGHFARLLSVDAAYHSTYMVDVAARYRLLMEQNCGWEAPRRKGAAMHSSVTGSIVKEGVCGPGYWEANMVQPVQFNSAVQGVLSSGVDTLIEIGPSNALSGPLKQIRQAIGSRAEYFSAWKCGTDALFLLFDTIGNLFIKGSPINLAHFNEEETPQRPSTIVDLPNYCWNHSTKYWSESRASKDWRFRKFLRHDLLGSKVLGTPWTRPTWQTCLRLQDVSWLRDHKLGDSTVFPAAGYVSMAIEAMYQMTTATGRVVGITDPAQLTYQLRNVEFLKAMMLEDGGADHHLFFTLNPQHGSNDTWYEFDASSIVDDSTSLHSKGLIRIGQVLPIEPLDTDMQPLQHSTPADVWYKSMHDVGYSFGNSFQKQLSVESMAGSRRSRSLVSMEWPESSYKQSSYPLHPAVIDGCFQTSSASLWAGHRSSINAVLVPRVVDSLIILSQSSVIKTGMAISTATFAGPGRETNPTSFSSHVTVFDTNTRKNVFQMQGLQFSSLERNKTAADSHVFNRTIWKPDISFCSQTELDHRLGRQINCTDTKSGLLQRVGKILDMITFKFPEAKILEINGDGGKESIWLGQPTDMTLNRAAYGQLHLHAHSSEGFGDSVARYGSTGKATLAQSESLESWDSLESEAFDVVIFKASLSPKLIPEAVSKARQLLRHNGFFVFLNNSQRDYTLNERLDMASTVLPSIPGFQSVLSLRSVPPLIVQENCISKYIFGITNDSRRTHAPETAVSVAQFSKAQACLHPLTTSLAKLGWQLSTHTLPFNKIKNSSTVIVLEELFTPLLSSITDEAWSALQGLVRQGCRILWVTCGSQMTITNPERSLIHGLARSICNEDPNSIFMTLDVGGDNPKSIAKAIDEVLKRLVEAENSVNMDTEFVERKGVMHVGRVLLDDAVNNQAKADKEGAEPKMGPLFEQMTTVRLISERPGLLESLSYVPIPDSETSLPSDHVEVGIHAASLNFKDIAISLGLVPGNEHLIGLEGAGTVRRIGKGVQSIHIGQRVVVNRKGSLANRVQGREEGEIFPLPDWMSFDDASTLTTVYSTVLYGLFDLANTQHGQSVLIHSAAGGVGLAAIQVCRYLGAEIYATVGSDEKREFLVEEYGIPEERILSSRSVEKFEPQLMRLTQGKGDDIVFNSLTGEMLHASWCCIATSGTFVEIRKRDILDRASISMEPFNRNASYRAVDMSHECISFPLKARLLTQIFDLLEKGHIKPIHISRRFTFKDVHAAFRYMRSGSSIGKIVITRGGAEDTIVPIRPVAPALNLDPNASYFIVGGLKGLCGSVAVYLARNGATNITVLSRSGYDDDKSQAVIRDIQCLAGHVDLVVGDVTQVDAVERAFRTASKPVRGIIQGAMVLRDKMYDSMSGTEFREALDAKVKGTWNLHNMALRLGLDLHFFTMLSSICGLAGQKGQANYSAANVFLDSFAAYRHSMGLPACSVYLGVIEDVGYVNERESLARRLLAQDWIPIGENLLHKILHFSILQQGKAPINPESSTQLITGMPFPLPRDSPAMRDMRFSHLRRSARTDFSTDDAGGGSGQSSAAVLKKAWKAVAAPNAGSAEHTHLLDILIDLANQKLTTSLGMDEAMDPARLLMSYGIDFLVAVDFRNWTRTELGIEMSTLEIVGAKTLETLAEGIWKRGFGRGAGEEMGI